MSLFPAYGEALCLEEDQLAEKKFLSYDVSEAMEVQLLASDAEDEKETCVKVHKQSLQSALSSENFYFDSKLDNGNLYVSTLYYPGRPQYTYTNLSTIGSKKRKKHENNWHRYFSIPITDETDTSLAERLIAYRKLLTETPNDLQLWEAYIDFREVCENVEGALEAAREAVTKLPQSGRLRERLFNLMQVVLPHRQYVEELRDILTKERRLSVRTEVWARVVAAAGAEGQAEAVLRTALADTRLHPPAATRLIHAFGICLRTAGLWERLVLAVELLGAMNLSSPFTPPSPGDAEADLAEQRLLDLEDKAIRSGLPSSAVWTRVERARAAAHWRPASALAAAADPQRAPLPHDVADLLLPVVGAARVADLAMRLLLLAKVPVLPATEAAARALGERDGTAEAALALVLEQRLLPTSASAAPLLELLTDPPHYFSDDTGYGGWVSALWEACCASCNGVHREALVCWRLRWLHALLLAAPPARRSERAALHRQARGVLKRLAPSSPLAFAEFALLEASAARGEGGNAEKARAAAAHALRAALDAHRPVEEALYVARVVCEVSGAQAEAAVVQAVLRTAAPPDTASREAALAICEERCSEVERRLLEEGQEAEADVTSALRPSAGGEWARARILLAGAARRRQLLARLLHVQSQVESGESEPLRYYEESAVELTLRGAVAGAEHHLARLYPGNAYLALVSADRRGSVSGAAATMQRRTSAVAPPLAPQAALAVLLPPFLRALSTEWRGTEAARAVRAARRTTEGAGGAAAGGAAAGGAAWAARIEAEARAPNPRSAPALFTALQITPHDKWLHVRGARWGGGEASVLADALLEKQLRLHALPDELLPVAETPSATLL